jgi:hypothetical protein
MRRVIGAFEKVSFPDFGLFNVVAKIDTGATSGSLHVTNIKKVSLPTGQTGLSFRPYGKKPAVVVNSFQKKNVRSSNGVTEMRYIIPTTIVVRKVQYPIQISLADRSLMMKGVLVGRRFLRNQGFIVDPEKGTKYLNHIKDKQ